MIHVNWDRVKRDGLIILIAANFIFASVLTWRFNSLKRAVEDSKSEARVVNIQQNQKISNSATAQTYTFIIDRDVFKNYSWEIDEIRSGVERYCPDRRVHWFSKKECFLRIKPSILDTYKTNGPLGFNVSTVGETVYISYWKKNVTK
jgi:hypothetical protein